MTTWSTPDLSSEFVSFETRRSDWDLDLGLAEERIDRCADDPEPVPVALPGHDTRVLDRDLAIHDDGRGEVLPWLGLVLPHELEWTAFAVAARPDHHDPVAQH